MAIGSRRAFARKAGRRTRGRGTKASGPSFYRQGPIGNSMVPHERYLEAGGVLAFPSISPAVRSAFAQSTRVCVSAGVIALVLTGGREVRHVNVTAIALALVLVALCIALVWQWLEALVAVARRADEFRAAVFDALAHEATGPLGTLEIAATMLA